MSQRGLDLMKFQRILLKLFKAAQIVALVKLYTINTKLNLILLLCSKIECLHPLNIFMLSIVMMIMMMIMIIIIFTIIIIIIIIGIF